MTWGDKPGDYKVLCKGVRTNQFLLLDSEEKCLTVKHEDKDVELI